jgi:hypothetical protein
MAIKLIGNYAKRLGLPGFSSHQYSISVETELSDSGDIQREASRIYDLLQDAVDREIQQTGFVPGESYGLTENGSTNRNGNGSHESSRNTNSNGNGKVRWSCSEKQKEFIGNIVAENDLDPASVESIAFDRFGVGVRQLNKTQASGLIDELLALCEKRGCASNGRN